MIENTETDLFGNPLPNSERGGVVVQPLVSFFACDSVTHEGETNTWFTPPGIVKPLGDFDLDPCTQTFRPFDTAKKCICEDEGMCGLSEPWEGRVWLNPPYGTKIARWLGKLKEHGNGIACVFARCETQWGQFAIRNADAVNFLKGRIAFIRADGRGDTNAGTGSMLLAFGRKNVEAIKRHEGVIFEANARGMAPGSAVPDSESKNELGR